jgi:hypothetical protein
MAFKLNDNDPPQTNSLLSIRRLTHWLLHKYKPMNAGATNKQRAESS